MKCDEILDKFIHNNFKFNRGIMLGVISTITLFVTAVSLIFTINSSINKTTENKIVDTTGDLQLTLYDVPKENMYKYDKYEKFLSQDLGYAKFDSISLKKDINIIGIDTENIDRYGITLIDGRFPKNSNEIVITEDISINDREDAYQINNIVSVKLQNYFNRYNQKTNQLSIGTDVKLQKKSIGSKEYTIVGTVKLKNRMFYSYSSIGYAAFTKFDEKLTDNYILSLKFYRKILMGEIADIQL